MPASRPTPPIPDPRERPTLTVREAAPLLDIGEKLAYELVRTGRFPCRVLRVGTLIKIPTTDLLALLGLDGDTRASA